MQGKQTYSPSTSRKYQSENENRRRCYTHPEELQYSPDSPIAVGRARSTRLLLYKRSWMPKPEERICNQHRIASRDSNRAGTNLLPGQMLGQVDEERFRKDGKLPKDAGLVAAQSRHGLLLIPGNVVEIEDWGDAISDGKIADGIADPDHLGGAIRADDAVLGHVNVVAPLQHGYIPVV